MDEENRARGDFPYPAHRLVAEQVDAQAGRSEDNDQPGQEGYQPPRQAQFGPPPDDGRPQTGRPPVGHYRTDVGTNRRRQHRRYTPVGEAQKPDAPYPPSLEELHRCQHVPPFQIPERRHPARAAAVGAEIQEQYPVPGPVQHRRAVDVAVHAPAVAVQNHHCPLRPGRGNPPAAEGQPVHRPKRDFLKLQAILRRGVDFGRAMAAGQVERKAQPHCQDQADRYQETESKGHPHLLRSGSAHSGAELTAKNAKDAKVSLCSSRSLR